MGYYPIYIGGNADVISYENCDLLSLKYNQRKGDNKRLLSKCQII